MRYAYKNLITKPEEDLGEDESLVFDWILNKSCVTLWTGCM